MDLCLFALNNEVPTSEVAAAVGLTIAQVERVYKDILSKRRTTRYQHLGPQLVETVEKVGTRI
jgi:NAD+ synthase